MKGLLILFNFSKKGRASSIQNIRFVRGLEKVGLNFDIITFGDQFSFDGENIYQINARSTKLITSILIRLLPDLVNLPDMDRFFWTKKVINSLDQIVDVKKYDWIHTTSSPQSIHLIGKHFKNKYGIPWVAQFYDPWVDNNFRSFKFSYLRRKDKELEAKVAKDANLIIHTNTVISNKWIERYGKEFSKKIVTLPLCTDENLTDSFIDEVLPRSNKFILVHTGGIYGSRKLDDLIEAILILTKDKEIDVLAKLEIRQIGYTLPSELKKVADNNLSNYFTFYGRKDYEFAINQARNSNALLLIDNPINDNVFFPSKLCEYFSLNKPILGIVPTNSEAINLLKESKHFYVRPTDVNGLAKSLKQLILNEKIYENISPNFYKKFLPENIAKVYVDLIKNLINNR